MGFARLTDNWQSNGQNAQVGRHDVLAVLAVPVGPKELVRRNEMRFFFLFLLSRFGGPKIKPLLLASFPLNHQ